MKDNWPKLHQKASFFIFIVLSEVFDGLLQLLSQQSFCSRIKTDSCCFLKRLIFHYLVQVGPPNCHYPHISAAWSCRNVVNGTFRLLNDLPEPLVEQTAVNVCPRLKSGNPDSNSVHHMFWHACPALYSICVFVIVMKESSSDFNI